MTVSQAANTSPSVVPLGIAIIIFYLVLVPFTFYFAAKVLLILKEIDSVPVPSTLLDALIHSSLEASGDKIIEKCSSGALPVSVQPLASPLCASYL